MLPAIAGLMPLMASIVVSGAMVIETLLHSGRMQQNNATVVDFLRLLSGLVDGAGQALQ